MSINPFDPEIWKKHIRSPDDGRVVQNDPELWQNLLPFPKKEDNKYTRGHALIRGGGLMTGAARLAARAAQRMGAGLVTLAATEKSLPIYAEALESVIVRPVDTAGEWDALVHNPQNDVILIGPGLGLGALEKSFVLDALASGKSMVLDADVFTNFASSPDLLLKALHARCVLTPHEGEFERLFGPFMDSRTDRQERIRKAAALAGCIILLKGSETIISDPQGMAVVNTDAPPWLATAGAGDVLAGMILGLIAQKMPVFAAAGAAAWIHGRIAADFGLGLIAEDLVAGIPAALQNLLPPM